MAVSTAFRDVSTKFLLLDPAGLSNDRKRLTVIETNGFSTTYGNDAKERLVSDSTSGTNYHGYSYAYDANDNLTSSGESGLSFSVNLAGRIVTAVDGSGLLSSYSYDANSNLSVITDHLGNKTSMSYDYENRLQMHILPSGLVASYAYDGLGLKRLEMEYGGLITLIWDGADYVGMQVVNDSSFITQSLPGAIVHGQTYSVSVTFQNTGLAPWIGERGYSIMSQDPIQNTIWGTAVVHMPLGQIVPVGSQCTFTFNITAPSTPGTYPFAWECLCETGGFGVISTLTNIVVS